MKKILIFTYMQRHLKKMVPIIKELENHQEIKLTVLLMTQEEREIALQNNISHQMLDDFTEIKRDADFDLAWGLEPLLNAIDEIQPDLFMAIEVNYILRNGIRYCKQKGIPTLIVQHGTPNKYSLHAFAPFEADRFLAWGQFAKDFLVYNGVPEAKVILTGGAPFDRTMQLKPDREAIAQELNIEPTKKWIVFTTQGLGAGGRPSLEEIFTGVSSVAEEMLNHTEYQLIYQVHPSQTVEDIKKIVDTVEGSQAIVAKYKNTEELMAASDGIITFFSTTAIDAVLLDKPLILINLSGEEDFYPFVPMGVAFGVYTKEQFAEMINCFLYQATKLLPNYPKAKEYMNHGNDGKALERVLAECFHIVNL